MAKPATMRALADRQRLCAVDSPCARFERLGELAEGLVEYGPHADEVFALLRFACGTIAKLETSRVANERKRGLRAVYADGVVEIDFLSRTVTNTTPRPLGALELGDPLGESVAGFGESASNSRKSNS